MFDDSKEDGATKAALASLYLFMHLVYAAKLMLILQFIVLYKRDMVKNAPRNR